MDQFVFDDLIGTETDSDIESTLNTLDKLDEQILECFLKRMALSEKVAKFKSDSNMPTEDTTREMEILDNISKKSGNFSTYATALFRSVIDLSKDYQEHWTKAYNEEQKRQVEEMPGVYGTIGLDVEDNHEEQIHQMLALSSKVAYDYKMYDLVPESLESFLSRPDLQGINVASPYKTAVLTFCENISDDVLRCGNANTVVKKEDKLCAYNTDVDGFKYMVYASGINVEGKKILILGTGDVAKAVSAAMSDLGAGQIAMVSLDTPTDKEAVALHEDANIIVNATLIGAYPKNLEKPLSLRSFPRLTGVLDTVYNPELTALLMEAESLGIPHAGGIHFLVARAKAAYELFFDRKISNNVVSEIVTTLQKDLGNIILTGMPGCGKTTIALAVSAATGREVIDIDKEIEKYVGRSIADFTTKNGEEKLREVEHNMIVEKCKESGKIIAVGGNAVLNKENLPAMRQNGKIFFIRRDTDLIPTDSIPLSKSPETLKEMQKIRLPLYQEVADTEIENNGSVEETVKKLLRFI